MYHLGKLLSRDHPVTSISVAKASHADLTLRWAGMCNPRRYLKGELDNFHAYHD